MIVTSITVPQYLRKLPSKPTDKGAAAHDIVQIGQGGESAQTILPNRPLTRRAEGTARGRSANLTRTFRAPPRVLLDSTSANWLADARGGGNIPRRITDRRMRWEPCSASSSGTGSAAHT